MLTVGGALQILLLLLQVYVVSYEETTHRPVQSSLRYYSYMMENKKFSYHKQPVYQLGTQYVDGIYSNSVTLKSGSEVTEGH